MKRTLLLIPLVLLFSLQYSSAFAATNLHSELKGWKWHESTILGAISLPALNRGEEYRIARPGTKKYLSTHFWASTKSPKPRGLYLVIPGTGADAKSGTANLLADELSNDNFDALVVANPFSTAFQATFSSDGLVGFPQKDIGDADLMMNEAYKRYVKENGVPKEVRIIGYSLGGTYTAMFSQRKLAFNVSQYVVLNPPVRFGYAMDQLDKMLIYARNDDEFTLLTLIEDIVPIFRLATKGITQDILPLLLTRLNRPEYENANVIGASFAINLAAITYRLKRAKVFSDRENQVRMNERFLNMTFERYLGLVGIHASSHPAIGHTLFQKLIDDIDLKNILKPGLNRKKIVIVTNADDFLIQKRDIATLNNLGARNFYLFDYGGHCGNYWTDSFKKLLHRIAAQ